MRKYLVKLTSLLSVALAVALSAPQRATADDDDPPSRVARLSYTHGNVSFNPGAMNTGWPPSATPPFPPAANWWPVMAPLASLTSAPHPSAFPATLALRFLISTHSR